MESCSPSPDRELLDQLEKFDLSYSLDYTKAYMMMPATEEEQIGLRRMLNSLIERGRIQIELPVWAMSSLIETPRDIIFEMDLATLNSEMRRARYLSNLTTVAEDVLFLLQNDRSLFTNMRQLIQFTLCLQGPAEECLTIARNGNADCFLDSCKHVWLSYTMKKKFEKHELSDTGLTDLLSPGDVFDVMLKADLLLLRDLIEFKIDSVDHTKRLITLMKDLPLLNSEDWRDIVNLNLPNVGLVHANMIMKGLRARLIFFKDDSHKDLMNTISEIVFNLYGEYNWTLSVFDQWHLDKLRSEEDLRMFSELLRLMYEYGIPGTDMESITDGPPSDWIQQATKDVYKKMFDQPEEYSFETLTALIAQKAELFNPENTLTAEELRTQYSRYKNALGIAEGRYTCLSDIKHDVRNDRFSTGTSLEDMYTRAATAARAIQLQFGVKLRGVQVITLLLALNGRELQQARLLQVQTGEGKTFIVAALAICEAIRGIKVDVVTSSSELAINQYNDLKSFYDSIGLTVAHNANGNASKLFNEQRERNILATLDNIIANSSQKYNDRTAEECSSDQVYSANIVYGSVSDYMGDVLQSEFAGVGLRLIRGFEFVIVDEVDSMMIDGRDDCVRLSSKTPGMNDLIHIHTAIWAQMLQLKKMVHKIDDVWYYKEGCESYPLQHDFPIDQMAEDSTLEFLRKMLRFEDLATDEKVEGYRNKNTETVKEDYPKLIIPPYLRTFVEKQLPKWIESATKALFHMEPGVDYVIKNDQVVVVDAANTGVHHPTMRWSDGLHTYLLMKHGLYLEAESLATNFISNVAFFQRYYSNIIGVTGTIGGEASRKLLKSVYQVDFLDIPPFSKRRHAELMPCICADGETWLKEVVNGTSAKLKQGRAVLLIFNYIVNAQSVHEKLAAQFGDSAIKLYADSDGSEIADKTLEPGECIVATNIAGRGTDISVSEKVEETGGLHVVITFLPPNDRVERQNAGRTSRRGNKGTSQMIIDSSMLPPDILQRTMKDDRTVMGSSPRETLMSLKKYRDEACMKAVNEALEKLEVTKRRDEAFQTFMRLRNQKIERVDSMIKKYARSAVDTKFGKLLRVEENISDVAVEEEFKNMTVDDLIDNPLDAMNAGMAYLNANQHVDEGAKLLDRSIELFGDFGAAAHYKRAAYELMKYKSERNDEFMVSAIEQLKLAKRSLELKKLNNLVMLQITSMESKVFRALHKQFFNYNLLTSGLIQHIEHLIGRDVQQELVYVESRVQQVENFGVEQREDEKFGVLGMCLKTNGPLKVNKRMLETILPNEERREFYAKELTLLRDDGFEWLFEVNVETPFNWMMAGGLADASAVQICCTGAAALCHVGLGANVGFKLLEKGLRDVYYTIIERRKQSWAAHGAEKAIDQTMTMLSFGFSAIELAAKRVVASGAKRNIQITRGISYRANESGWTNATRVIGTKILEFEQKSSDASDCTQELFHSWTAEADKELHDRDRFVDSQAIRQDLIEKWEVAEKDDTSEKLILDHIEGAARDKPGDVWDAEILSEVIKQPIVVKAINDTSNELKSFGTRYFNKEPIVISYARVMSGKVEVETLYVDSNESVTGGFSCLYEAVGAKTGYDSNVLRKGVARVMLNDFDLLKQKVKARNHWHLVGGVGSRGRILAEYKIGILDDTHTAEHALKLMKLVNQEEKATKRAAEIADIFPGRNNDKRMALNDRRESI